MPQCPEGPHVPSIFTTLENGTAILDALEVGEVMGYMHVGSVFENRSTSVFL